MYQKETINNTMENVHKIISRSIYIILELFKKNKNISKTSFSYLNPEKNIGINRKIQGLT